ncbi:glycosyltransferase [Turicibacter bilis]|uniref:glycosyltransferase n=1 Tax=Turicibacter bilis TaxID=2735723 RepID=UPI0031BAD00E
MIKPKVSIIIPVYNVENYIRDCVESVVNQTLDNIEIIIVNDGCTDHSINRIDDLIKSNNLLIVNQENKGLSAARNIGLSYATGDYIAFIDSDDYIEPNFLQKLYECAEKYDLDIVMGGHTKVFENGDLIERRRTVKLLDSGLKTGQEILYNSIQLNDYYGEVWDDLYKREFLLENQLSFYEGILHEDEEFTLKCLLVAKRVKVVNSVGYMYRQRQGSIVNSTPSEKNMTSLLIILNNFIQIYHREKDEKVKYSMSRMIRRMIFYYEENLRKTNEPVIKYLKLLENKNLRKIMSYEKGLNLKLNLRYLILDWNQEIYYKLFYSKDAN